TVTVSYQRESSVLVYGCIHLYHKPNGLFQGRACPLIVEQIVISEGTPLPIFQPLLADLIPADVEVPDLRRYPVKILLLVDPYPPRSIVIRFRVSYRFHQIAPTFWVSWQGVACLLHQ